MKKLLLLLSLTLSTIALAAQTSNGNGNNGNNNNSQPVPLTVKPTDKGVLHNPLPKSPVQIPEVYQDGHTLYFDAAIEGCTVLLLDEDENVVFSHFIEENETSLTFPSTLTGTYELQIIRGSIVFYCEIEL